jgi:Transposase DDE domain
MHLATTRRHYVGKDGQERVYETHLLRRSYREDGKVKNETLANLSHLPAATIDLVRASLDGAAFVPATGVEVARSLPHGQVAAVWAQARGLGLPELLGPAGRLRDIALALLVARVVRPASKVATRRWWTDSTLAVDLAVADASRDEVYAALDWLAGQQQHIQARLAARHLRADGLAYFDLSSSWVTGSCCPLAARGYSRDGKRGLPQIEYGLLTDQVGRPVAVRVFGGDTADPTAFVEAVTVVTEQFGLRRLTLVGDRGMITSARIDALKADPDHQLSWITCLRAGDIAALAADDGPVQMSLFDQQDLAEIVHPNYPDERLIACRNPALAAERARKRAALLAATEPHLDAIKTAVQSGKLVDPAAIGIRVGKVLGKYKVGKHFILDIAAGHFGYTRNQAGIDAEAALDGIYVIRTCVPADTLPTADAVTAYKALSNVERDFRSLKTVDLDLRPIYHHTEPRVRAHVLLCMLAGYLVWHLRHAWAPLTHTDEHPPPRDNPVAKATRSPQATRKANTGTTTDELAVLSFHDLLDHLATLTRNTINLPGGATTDILATSTPTQRRAFELLHTPIPQTLT